MYKYEHSLDIIDHRNDNENVVNLNDLTEKVTYKLADLPGEIRAKLLWAETEVLSGKNIANGFPGRFEVKIGLYPLVVKTAEENALEHPIATVPPLVPVPPAAPTVQFKYIVSAHSLEYSSYSNPPAGAADYTREDAIHRVLQLLADFEENVRKFRVQLPCIKPSAFLESPFSIRIMQIAY